MSSSRCPPMRWHTTQNYQNKQTKISYLETNIFELKMTVKSDLEFFILKFYQPLPKCLLTCQANSAFPFLHWAAATLKGPVEFQNKKKLDHFSPSYLTQKCWFQHLRFQSTYSSSSRWCELGRKFTEVTKNENALAIHPTYLPKPAGK